MSVLHLWHSSGWRGGENQFRLLALHLPEAWKGHLGAPPDSELRKRMSMILPVHALDCGGFLDLRSIAKARALIRSRGIRLIHAHDSHGLTTALLARTGLGMPVVASRRSVFRIKSGWKYRACEGVVAVSAAAAQEVARAGLPDDAISVIPDAVDLKVLDEVRPERLDCGADETVVLCIAALTAEKDHRTLLIAWADVERHRPQARLHLAGSGALEGELRRLGSELGLKNVRFLGWRDDVPALTKGADIVVATSLAEGLGSSLCEAQAAGKPVVATRAGGIPEAIEDGVGGMLVEPGDHAGVAKALCELIDDPARRQTMGQAAAVRARRLFHPDAIARQHVDVYQSVIRQ